MNPQDSSSERQSARLTEVELQLMHLQKDFETLNEVVLQHGRRIEELFRLVQRLSNKFSAGSDETGERNPLDEKPPHY